MAGKSVGLRWIAALLGAALLCALGAAGTVWWWLDRPLSLASPSVELSIEPGTSPASVAQAWVDAGVQAPARALYEWFRWSGQARRIQAGSYEVGPGITPRTLLAKMVQGDQTLETVRFIEGWTVRQLRAELARAPNLKQTTAALSEAELMGAIGAAGVPAEGRFFPDTYAYSRGVSDLTVLKRAHQHMQQRLNAVWAERAPDTPLKTVDEALTLGSTLWARVVEKRLAKDPR